MRKENMVKMKAKAERRKVNGRTEALTPMSFIYSCWSADESACLLRLFLSLSSISEAVRALLATIDFVDGLALAVGSPIGGV